MLNTFGLNINVLSHYVANSINSAERAFADTIDIVSPILAWEKNG